MGALAQLSQTTVDVEPGRSVTIAITVRNNGTVVDRYTFDALGAAAPWVTFSPTSLSLFPEASGTVNVILAPPREPTVPAGPVPLGIRVASTEDPTGSTVEEASVNIGAFSDISVELVPHVARGRLVARTQLAVDNRSNCSYRAEVVGSDPQMMLAFAFRPPVVDVPPGGAAFVKVGIRPAKRFWRGMEKTRPFRLVLRNDLFPSELADSPAGAMAAAAADARTDGPLGDLTTPASPAGAGAPAPAAERGEPAAPRPSPHPTEIGVEGSMLQGPLLPKWLLAVLGALLALILLFLLLWFVLFKPQIRSTAQNEVNKQLTANGITPVTTAGGSKSGKGAGTGGTSSNGGTGGGSTPTTLSTGGSSSDVVGAGSAVNGDAQAVGNGTKVIFTVPNGRSLQVTDILVENSAGDTGNLALARSGTPVMEWSMANFRDLDYHWITPTVFGPGTKMELVVSGCTGSCTPGIYYAGHLVSG